MVRLKRVRKNVRRLTKFRVRDYSRRTPAKSGVGIETPDIYRRITALAVFLCAKHRYTQIMVGCVGQPKGWPDGRPVVSTLHSSPPND
ncbi:ash family protein [Salmonella enterica]|uniref:ash family protein n=1 Tax=Salmonella enterica TaxID=28901 RepID=UPI0009B12AAB